MNISNVHRAREVPKPPSLVDLARSYRLPRHESHAAVQVYLESLDCPRALTVWMLYKYKEHKQLCELEFDPRKFNTTNFSNSYAASCLFSKFDGLNTSKFYDREQLAYEKLLLTEVECWKANQRFRNLCDDPDYKGDVVWLHDAVRRKIASVLGSVDIETVLKCANWGPGATLLLKRSEGCSANKFQNESGITKDLAILLEGMNYFDLERGYSPFWARVIGPLKYFVGNRVGFVPKSSKIDRTIAIEPGLNTWIQKGIGGLIRRRLRKWGIDLNDQSRNQRLALKGSVFDELCTIDFSSASDSIARGLVEELLPPAWFRLLDLSRSHYGILPNDPKPVRWEKFSSMGNGFTFELESLIFAAIAFCCDEFVGQDSGDTSVYGDDVIVHRASLPLFLKMCAFYGFTVNASKSFWSSDFRESCGEHYLRGQNVTPIYLKKRVGDLPAAIRFYNAIRRRSRLTYGCDVRYRRACEFLIRLVPKRLRLRIPDGLGDGGFIGNFDEASPSKLRRYVDKNFLSAYLCKQLVDTSIPYPFSGEGLVLASLWRLERAGPGLILESGHRFTRWNKFCGPCIHPREGVVRESGRSKEHDYVSRKGFTELTVGELEVRNWPDLGPWL